MNSREPMVGDIIKTRYGYTSGIEVEARVTRVGEDYFMALVLTKGRAKGRELLRTFNSPDRPWSLVEEERDGTTWATLGL